ncbi:Fungal pheromone mating factor STE2 GPCR [Penicillium verhagenii]|uniref:Fungal pheromone mating factor STE2 GPCR n=1 Tax=Penicillium verhagenii TaxID=1562060 RepID=UPI00254528C2|nr:Fungal pheromone mating factor STE2 GPCR [Penicillium verhagenii]KAJ5930128.1 Fungal pheromone mating factor STE2 GPCR [Penicillium verhagenii]
MASFNPEEQVLTFHDRNGQPFSVPLPDLNEFVQYNVQVCIDYGTQLGATFVLFIVMILLTRRDKRRSTIFILNGLALTFNFLRLLFQCISYTTGFESIYPYFSGDYTDVKTGAYAISIVAVIFETLLVVCFEFSLVFQVHVICATLRRRYRRVLFVVSILMALVPIGFRLGWMVMNCKEIITLSSLQDIWWLEKACGIVITISISFFCLIFVTKLGFAIRQRRRLGIRDFGPMKAIFICGCQTLIVPTIVTIVQYAVTVPELASNVLTLVAISLPLSSIWAGATLDSRRVESVPPRRQNLWQALAFDGDTLTPTKQTATQLSGSIVAQTLCFVDPPMSKQSQDSDIPLGINVEHDISISSIHRNDSPV